MGPVYLAGPYRHRHVAADVAELLRRKGVVVTSRWHDGPAEVEPAERWALQRIVKGNVADMARARRIVVLGLEGGMETWVELGRALAWQGWIAQVARNNVLAWAARRLLRATWESSVPVVVDLGARLPASAGACCHVVTPASRSTDAIAEVVISAMREVL